MENVQVNDGMKRDFENDNNNDDDHNNEQINVCDMEKEEEEEVDCSEEQLVDKIQSLCGEQTAQWFKELNKSMFEKTVMVVLLIALQQSRVLQSLLPVQVGEFSIN